jgi:hypothetical protein
VGLLCDLVGWSEGVLVLVGLAGEGCGVADFLGAIVVSSQV